MIETLSESSDVMPGEFTSLYDSLQIAWSDLADSVFQPVLLFQLFDQIVHNPLCIAVSCALLVVFGFRIFAYIVSSFRSRS